MTPEPSHGTDAANPEPNSSLRKNTGSPRGPKPAWQRRLLRLTLALFTFEIGIFLIVFPWTENWNSNYFQVFTPAIQELWQQPSFRGALTGLGFVNIYIAILQVFYALRRT